MRENVTDMTLTRTDDIQYVTRQLHPLTSRLFMHVMSPGHHDSTPPLGCGTQSTHKRDRACRRPPMKVRRNLRELILLVQSTNAVHFGHVSPPPRAHMLCSGVWFLSKRREPHTLRVNIGRGAGPFLCGIGHSWYCVLGGTFKTWLRSVLHVLGIGCRCPKY